MTNKNLEQKSLWAETARLFLEDAMEEDTTECRGYNYEYAAYYFRKAGMIEEARAASVKIRQGYLESAKYHEKEIKELMLMGNFCRGLLESHARDAILSYKKTGDPRAQLKPEEIFKAQLEKINTRKGVCQLVVSKSEEIR